MTTRKSKIARLPFDIREDLNNRLLENVPTKDILIWLSTDSTVIAVLRQLFQGRYITEQNLSEWRQGGYQEWLTYRSTIDTVRDLSEDAVRIALTDISGEHLVLALTAIFASMIKKMDQMPEIAFNRKLIVVQDLIRIALSLRRSEQRDARLKLDRERLEILREKNRDKSPSSGSSWASSYSSLRPCPAHPMHPKAPEIRRPPAPPDPNAYPDDPNDPDWPPHVPECYRSGPDPDDPEVADSLAAQSPVCSDGGEPNPETPNWLD